MLHMLHFFLKERIRDLNSQAKQFVDAGHFDAPSIQEKQDAINKRYDM